MQLVIQPQFSPGVCLICGGASKPWYLDTMYSAEFWGNIYYCNECFAHMAMLCKFGSIELHEERIKELEEIANELAEKVDVYESAISAVGAVTVVDWSFSRDRLAHQAIDSIASVALDSEDESGSGTDESLDDEGMDDIRPASERDKPVASLDI